MSLSKLTSTNNNSFAGILYFLSGAIILMGIITAEVYYPQYSTLKHFISDLGSTRPPDPIAFQPSASIFNFSMIIAGLFIILASLILMNISSKKALLIPSFFLGIGVFGIGIFPGNFYFTHPIFAFTAFISGGVAGLASYSLVSKPYGLISIGLGTTALIFLLFFNFFSNYLGVGGAERWIAYPIILWLCSYGSYLMGQDHK